MLTGRLGGKIRSLVIFEGNARLYKTTYYKIAVSTFSQSKLVQVNTEVR